MGLNQTVDLIGNLDLSGMWVGMVLRTDARKTCVYKRLDYALKMY